MNNEKKRILNLHSNWTFKNIKKHIPLIAENYWTSIQISPIQKCKDGNFWCFLYQPLGKGIGNMLGTEDDFYDLCEEAHKYNIDVFPDCVLRHTATKIDNSSLPYEKVNDDIARNPYFWMCNGQGIDVNNREDVLWKDWGTPTLDYTNEELINNYYIPFIKKVLSHADGLRLDECKHFVTLIEHELIKHGKHKYNGKNNLLEIIYNLSKENNSFIYGETINSDKKVLNLYIPLIKVLIEYNTQIDTQIDKKDCVVFFESHDTYNTFGYTKWMDNQARLDKWLWLVSLYPYCLYYARENDETIFCEKMKQINKSVLNL